jgi:hypothetical protein
MIDITGQRFGCWLVLEFAQAPPDKRGAVMIKIIAPKCPGPKKGFFDRGLVPCVAFDHAPGGAVALWKSKTFLWLELSLCHARRVTS